jgi:hypothetical protein
MADAQRSETPAERLTRMADRLAAVLEADPEYEPGDQAVIMLSNAGLGRCGIGLFGYESDTEAMAAMLTHLKAIFEANGKQFEFLAL